MPSFRRRASVIDSGAADETPPVDNRGSDGERARALAEEAEAEAAEAEAAAAAARARARALRLRREADAADAAPEVGAESGSADTDQPPPEVSGENDSGDTADDGGDAADDGGDTADDTVESLEGAADEDDTSEAEVGEDAVQAPARRRWRPRVPRPTWKGIAAAVAVVAIAALLVLSGLMIWQHRQAEERRQLDAEYAAAARQSVVTLMSIDFNNAQEDVQRIIDNSTGQFKDDFEMQAEDFVQVAKDSKVITEVTVNSTAVESMTDDSAVVLVSALSQVTNSAGANQEPRTWRLAVDLQRDGGQIKMSKVEFVP